ncbi:MAG: hypothetical protein QOH37_507 [Nocardioidaceae bacterium]|nr:hypothetical protein [Nocardioidaceae bacterium]
MDHDADYSAFAGARWASLVRSAVFLGCSLECLYCYVARMLDEHGRDCTLRWAGHYRDLRAPRATTLERRLGSMGGRLRDLPQRHVSRRFG